LGRVSYTPRRTPERLDVPAWTVDLPRAGTTNRRPPPPPWTLTSHRHIAAVAAVVFVFGWFLLPPDCRFPVTSAGRPLVMARTCCCPHYAPPLWLVPMGHRCGCVRTGRDVPYSCRAAVSTPPTTSYRTGPGHGSAPPLPCCGPSLFYGLDDWTSHACARSCRWLPVHGGSSRFNGFADTCTTYAAPHLPRTRHTTAPATPTRRTTPLPRARYPGPLRHTPAVLPPFCRAPVRSRRFTPLLRFITLPRYTGSDARSAYTVGLPPLPYLPRYTHTCPCPLHTAGTDVPLRIGRHLHH